MKLSRSFWIIMICVLASAPLAFIAHECFHWVVGQFTDFRDPMYMCLNLQAYSDNESHPGLMFVLYDLKSDEQEINVEDYTSVRRLAIEETIAMLITIIIMGILSFLFVKKILKENDTKK